MRTKPIFILKTDGRYAIIEITTILWQRSVNTMTEKEQKAAAKAFTAF